MQHRFSVALAGVALTAATLIVGGPGSAGASPTAPVTMPGLTSAPPQPAPSPSSAPPLTSDTPPSPFCPAVMPVHGEVSAVTTTSMTISYSVSLGPPCGYNLPLLFTLFASENDANKGQNPVAEAVSGSDRTGTVTVTGLTADTRYWVRVTSNDPLTSNPPPYVLASGRTAAGPIPTPTITCPPMIPIGATVSTVTSTSMTLSYTIHLAPPCGYDPPVLFSLYASSEEAYQGQNPVATALTGPERNGLVTVTGLKAATKYWVRAGGTDQSNSYVIASGQTAPVLMCPPVMPISAKVDAVTTTSMTISYSISIAPPCGYDPPVLFTFYDNFEDYGQRRNPVAEAVSGPERTGKVTVDGLTADTEYWVRVSATDGSNSYAIASGRTASESACAATVVIDNSWNGGFVATVSVRNTGTQPLNGWRVSWPAAAGQQIQAIWNAELADNSTTTVTARNAAYNGRLAPGGSASFGMVVWANTAAAGITATCGR